MAIGIVSLQLMISNLNNALHPGILFVCRLLIFSKSTFTKNSFRNTVRVTNSLDPDQAGHFVGPDLGPNCLQKLSADGTWS